MREEWVVVPFPEKRKTGDSTDVMWGEGEGEVEAMNSIRRCQL